MDKLLDGLFNAFLIILIIVTISVPVYAVIQLIKMAAIARSIPW